MPTIPKQRRVYLLVKWILSKGFCWLQSAHDFIELVLDSNLFQVIYSPRRGDNTLDLLCITTPGVVISVTTNEPLCSLIMLLFNVNLSLMSSNKNHSHLQTDRFDWNNVDWNPDCTELQLPNWLGFYNPGDVNAIYQNILNSIWTICAASVPSKHKNHSKSAIWETAAFRLVRKEIVMVNGNTNCINQI